MSDFLPFCVLKILLAFIQCWQNPAISQWKKTDSPSAVSVVSAKKAQNCCQNAPVDCLEELSMPQVQGKPG